VRPTSTNRATGDRAVRQQIRFFQNDAAFSLDKRQPQPADAGMLRAFAFISRNDRLAKHRHHPPKKSPRRDVTRDRG
jgi:hypothetical protein